MKQNFGWFGFDTKKATLLAFLSMLLLVTGGASITVSFFEQSADPEVDCRVQIDVQDAFEFLTGIIKNLVSSGDWVVDLRFQSYESTEDGGCEELYQGASAIENGNLTVKAPVAEVEALFSTVKVEVPVVIGALTKALPIPICGLMLLVLVFLVRDNYRVQLATVK